MIKRTNPIEEYLELVEGLPQFEEYTYWEQLSNRKIILNTQIDECVIERVILQILKFNQEDKGKTYDERKPIVIYLSTPGGQVDVGLVLCNVIEQSKTPVYVVTLAHAASMGALILMAGHKRFAYPFSSVLIHDGSMFVGGSTGKVRDQVKFQDEKEEQIKQYILTKTKISDDEYDKNYDREWWMTAQTAKELGIIDVVIGVDVEDIDDLL